MICSPLSRVLVLGCSTRLCLQPKTDEEEHVQIKGQAAIAKLGKIVIRIRQGAQVLDQRTRIPRGTESQVGLVHEKQLKYISHFPAVD